MKRIICFGDSNTYGFNPENGFRHEQSLRWTGILSQILGETFEVIEEGCNNRTIFSHNPDGEIQTGHLYLPKLLQKNDTFEYFILALGTNDMQTIFSITPTIVKNGLKTTVKLIKAASCDAKIVIIPPVLLTETVLNGYFNHQFDAESIERSKWIQPIYQEIAKQENCIFCDINKFVVTSDFDGLHFDEEAHKSIAKIVSSHIL